MMSFNYPPKGWAQANGQTLPINQNQPLFSLFGTMYGGDGRTTFKIPDLRDRVPLHVGAGFVQGQAGGENTHTLSMGEMPAHIHFVQASTTDGNAPVPFGPSGNILARTVNNIYHVPDNNLTTLNAATIGTVGGSQAHENRQPYLTIEFCVALQGIFPSRN